jgi:WhiB family redox-sensing transcriptional regulator
MLVGLIDLPSLAVPDKDSSWRELASCKGSDPNKFFRERGSTGYSAERLLCALCPVRDNCLDFALSNHIQHGFFGGFSKEERQQIDAGKLSRDITATQLVKDLRRLKHEDPVREVSRLLIKSEDEVHEMLSEGR